MAVNPYYSDEQRHKPVGIIAGGGDLPSAVAMAAQRNGRDVFMACISGEADFDPVAWQHAWVKWGELGRLFNLLHQHNCVDLVMIGRVARPRMRDIRFDFGGLKHLPKIARMMAGGDGRLLDGLAKLFADQGFRLCGAHELAPELLLADETITHQQFEPSLETDFETGLRLLHALGPFDVGQAVVIDRGRVIGIEAVEGTDLLLERCAELRRGRYKNNHALLIKWPKPSQDLRVDMPVIGVGTIERAAQVGIRTIIGAADATLLVDRQAIIEAANRHGICVVGRPARDLGDDR